MHGVSRIPGDPLPVLLAVHHAVDVNVSCTIDQEMALVLPQAIGPVPTVASAQAARAEGALSARMRRASWVRDFTPNLRNALRRW